MQGPRLLGREMLPPFDSGDLTVIMTAVAEGLQMRHGADPAAVRDGLYADTISAVLLGITRPRVERSETDPAPELAAIAVVPLTTEEGPIRRIEEVLLRYVQLAPSCTSAPCRRCCSSTSPTSASSTRPCR